ncbi:MAG: hypothetical protein HUJ26_18145 [Planctomycetaceae bacterium]|nr:hypothetical protein [Planctomycetaceae bacterium]
MFGTRLLVFLSSIPLILASTQLSAVERPTEILPASTVIYVEIAQPKETIETILNHRVAEKVRAHPAYQQATQTPQYKQFQTVLKFVESQLGMKWLEAIDKLTQGGVSFAFDAQTQGVALIFEAESAESLEDLREKVMQFVRQDAENKGNEDPYEEHAYREIPVYKTKQGLLTTYQNWLVMVNKPELGRQLLDGLLDGARNSLAEQENFQRASATADNKIIWGYANLETIRDSGVAEKAFAGKADDPGAELIFGGVLEILPHAAYVTASLDGLPEQLQLSVSLPFQSDWISAEREHYFGPEAKGEVTTGRYFGESIASLSVYRNVSEMWLRAGDLFNEKINEQFAKADTTLTTLFSGKDFGEDILAAISPEMQVVVSRQEFSADRPTPEIKLPAFGLVTRLKTPEQTTPEFQRIFMSFIGFLNVAGGAEGRPQLDLNLESLEEGRIVSTRFVPLASQELEEQNSIAYNFSPTLAFQNDLFILSSTTELARGLLASKEIPIELGSEVDPAARINTALNLNAEGIRRALEDNREHLISKNILEKGHSREEAEGEIGVLFEILRIFQSAGLQVLTTDQTFQARLNFTFAE